MPYLLPYQKIIDYTFDKIIDKDKIHLVTNGLPIFISSRMSGLETVREMLSNKFSENGFPVIGWEIGIKFGVAQSFPTRDVYLLNLKKSLIYIGIIDKEYGNIDSDIGISPTEDEYYNAVSENKEILLFVSMNSKDKKAEELVDKWKKNHTITFYKDLSDLDKKIDITIAGLLVRHSENWIMLGDLIFNSPYRIINNEIVIHKITANREVVNYFNSFKNGMELKFIDMNVGEVLYTEFISIEVIKNYAKIFEFQIKLKQLPSCKRMTWDVYKNCKGMSLNNISNWIYGEEHLKQSVKFCMMVGRGEVLYSQAGSNLYNICQKYHTNIPLAIILIKFDIIELLLSTHKQFDGEITVVIPCLKSLELLSVDNIKENGFTCKIKLFIDGIEPFIFDYNCSFDFYDKE